MALESDGVPEILERRCVCCDTMKPVGIPFLEHGDEVFQLGSTLVVLDDEIVALAADADIVGWICRFE